VELARYFERSGTSASVEKRAESKSTSRSSGDQTRLDYELTVVAAATVQITREPRLFSWLAYGDTMPKRYDCLQRK
jgi:hypothetical protein